MRRRRNVWVGETMAALAILSGCTDSSGARSDAGGTLDGTTDVNVQPDGPPGDTGAPDATTVDVGVEAEAEAEASCAVDAGPLDDAEVQLGQSVVTAHRCTSCHGLTLSGNYDGVPSPTTEGGFAYPPNLTPDPATGLGCWTDDQIENAFLNGIDNEGVTLCPPMPRFGHLDAGAIDAVQARAVVEYLRSLPAISMNVPSTPSCVVSEGGMSDDAGPALEAGVEAGIEAGPDASDDAPDGGSEAAVDAQDAAGD